MDLSFDEIRRIHRLEKNTSQLVEVEKEFYNELHAFLQKEKQAYLESLKDFSVSDTRRFSNLKKMVEEIFSMREKKLLNKALIASRTKEASEEHMALQEKELFKKMLELLEEHGALLNGLFENEAAGKKPSKDLNNLSVRILSDIPEFVGSDMKEYGPYRKGQKVAIPLKIAKLLESRKLGEVVREG